MKFIHTADWHLGQTFYEYERKEEHRLFLSWLKGQLKEQGADVLLVAGDVFDSPNPSAEAQTMYYRFLREATEENPQLQIIVIAGNHDSAARLEAPNPLLEDMRVRVRGTVARRPDGEIDYARLLLPLEKGGRVEAWCMAVPYLRQGDYPAAANYSEGVGKLYHSLYAAIPGPPKPVLAMGHLQATGSEISDHDSSERTIIGGLESVSPDSFPPGIAYAALGHLHRAQRVSGRENVRYAGAPLPMSFAEKNNRQGVTLVEAADGETRITRLEFEPPVALLSIPREPGPLQTVLDEISALPQGEATAFSPFLEVKVKITEPEPSLRYQVEEALKDKAVRLARIVPVLPRPEKDARAITFEELQTLRPMDMALDIFRHKYGGNEMPPPLQELLQTAIREAGK
jgi:exonuclease SbcD